eukprot:5931491-Pyramimonas_sp.AAC.1
MAPDMAHDSGRWAKIASDASPRGFKTPPRRFRVLSEASEYPSPPNMPTSFKHPWAANGVAFSRFGLPWVLGASRWPHYCSSEPQAVPKRAPSLPRERLESGPRGHN